MKILNNYYQCDKQTIKSLPKKQLQQAILNLLAVNTHKFKSTDSYHGDFLLPDELADAFRKNLHHAHTK